MCSLRDWNFIVVCSIIMGFKLKATSILLTFPVTLTAKRQNKETPPRWRGEVKVGAAIGKIEWLVEE